MTHMALSFVTTHPAVTAAIIGPRTTEQLDDLLAAADTVLTDEVLDRIDEIATPGTNIGCTDIGYTPSSLTVASQRRRAAADRSSA